MTKRAFECGSAAWWRAVAVLLVGACGPAPMKTAPPLEAMRRPTLLPETHELWELGAGTYRVDGVPVAIGDVHFGFLRGEVSREVVAHDGFLWISLDVAGETHEWRIADRLALHVCAAEAFDVPGRRGRVERGARLYLRGEDDDEYSVALSPAAPAVSFVVPKSATTLEGCVASTEPLATEGVTENPVELAGLVVPAGVTRVTRFPDFVPKRGWLLPAGDGLELLLRDEQETLPFENGGSIAKASLRAAIRAEIRDVFECFDWRIRRGALRDGRIEVRFVLGDRGQVRHVETLEPGHLDLPSEICAARAIARARFPPTGGLVVIAYPFSVVLE